IGPRLATSLRGPCYRVPTDGNRSSREIRLFDSLLDGFERQISIPNQGVENRMPDQSFAALGVSAEAASTLAARDIVMPFPVPTLVLPEALAGRDVLAKSPTGSGKTIAFAVPIVERLEAGDPRPSALVLAPTREPACQIVDDIRPLAKARALSVAAVYGGAGIEPQIKR